MVGIFKNKRTHCKGTHPRKSDYPQSGGLLENAQCYTQKIYDELIYFHILDNYS